MASWASSVALLHLIAPCASGLKELKALGPQNPGFLDETQLNLKLPDTIQASAKAPEPSTTPN